MGGGISGGIKKFTSIFVYKYQLLLRAQEELTEVAGKGFGFEFRKREKLPRLEIGPRRLHIIDEKTEMIKTGS